MSSRVPYFDNAKFILIVLVIFGHLLQNNGLNDNVSIGLFDTIFTFAMPSFIFLSGLFTSKPDRKSVIAKRKFWRSQITLFETLVFFSFILYLPTWYYSGWDWSRFLRPGYTLWYLLALIWWRFMVYYLPRNILSKKYILIFVSILLSFLSGFIPFGNSIALQRTLFFLPYFVVGYLLSNYKDVLVLNLRKIPLGISVAFVLLLLLNNILFHFNQLPYNTGNVCYSNWNMSLLVALCWKTLFSVLSTLASVAVLSMIPDSLLKISKFGEKSLLFYVYHAILLTFIRLIVSKFQLPQNFYMAVTEFAIVLSLLICISKYTIAFRLLSPLSNINNHK